MGSNMDSVETLEHVAKLARLGPYTQERKEKLAKEFGRILDLFKTLEKLPARKENKDEKHPWHSADGTPFRADIARQEGNKERVISNFPEREGVLLRVPKVIDSE